MLRCFVKVVIDWNLVTNATNSSVVDVAMVLDTCLCFFRKSSNATCFIIYFNMWSQIRTLWKQFPVQRERDDKNMKICQFWSMGFMSLSQKYEERVRKFSFLTRNHFKADLYRYIYIVKHLSELYWIVLMCFKILNASLVKRTSDIKS